MADRDGLADRANCLGIEPLPIKAGSATKAVPGYDVRILDNDGAPMPARRGGRRRDPAPAPARYAANVV